jgi:hypothetical protein
LFLTAYLISWGPFFAPDFRIMLARRVSIVLTLVRSLIAISLLVKPSLISCSVSNSLRLNSVLAFLFVPGVKTSGLDIFVMVHEFLVEGTNQKIQGDKRYFVGMDP